MELKIIRHLGLGAFVGCFITMFSMVLTVILNTPCTVYFSGVDIVNAFLGAIVIGWAFSLSGLIYYKEDLAFPIQVIFQMVVGMSVLYATAVYLKWMPIESGLQPILIWILISCIICAVFWIGFYVYHYLVARDLNKKLGN